jgi:hypothetical protein
MGISATIDGDVRAALEDPNGLVNWLLSFPTVETTACLKFVDAYGQTIFNRLQLPVLKEELKALSAVVTPEGVGLAKERYLDSTSMSAATRRVAVEHIAGISVDDLKAHLKQLISLVDDCIAQGPHHVVCFCGD